MGKGISAAEAKKKEGAVKAPRKILWVKSYIKANGNIGCKSKLVKPDEISS